MSERLYSCPEIAIILNRDKVAIYYHLRKLHIVPNAKHGLKKYYAGEIIERLMLPIGTFREPAEVSPAWQCCAEQISADFHRQFIGLVELAYLVGYERDYFGNMMRVNNGPKPTLINRERFYLKSEVLDWIAVHKPDKVLSVQRYFERSN